MDQSGVTCMLGKCCATELCDILASREVLNKSNNFLFKSRKASGLLRGSDLLLPRDTDQAPGVPRPWIILLLEYLHRQTLMVLVAYFLPFLRCLYR